LGGDAYNAFNRVNLTNPTRDLKSVNFGKPTGQNTPGPVQVAVLIVTRSK
jgi:hypothetical protein